MARVNPARESRNVGRVRPRRLQKICFFVIPSEARDLLFFAKPKKKQIPRANPALRNDSLIVLPQPLQPCRKLLEEKTALAAARSERALSRVFNLAELPSARLKGFLE